MDNDLEFNQSELDTKNWIKVGSDLYLEMKFVDKKKRFYLYRGEYLIKTAVRSDQVEKKLFMIEAVELGAKKTLLAKAMKISRTTLDQNIKIKEYFGITGLIQGYKFSDSTNKREQREMHTASRLPGNRTEQIKEIEAKGKIKIHGNEFNFANGTSSTRKIKNNEHIFSDNHDWQETRYAGMFIYLITLIQQWRWMELIIGYFGSTYKIFMVFLLMVTKNIKSIEQLKNIRLKEAGAILGIGKLPSLPKVWEWFYNAAEKNVSQNLLTDYFKFQIRGGLVSVWQWFTDGHLLPYTGKDKVHYSYNTQRRMPVPGQSNLVTCDINGNIVDFEIQEGKGDLKGRISELRRKWETEIPEGPIMVFDREGSGRAFFWGLVQAECSFVTWEKHVDKKKLDAIGAEQFSGSFTFNTKEYSVFEEKKQFEYKQDNETHSFKLRRIYIWNKKTDKRVCGLAWDKDNRLDTENCAKAILSRWGASENTFKHIATRHPLHYHPGFKLISSGDQEIVNPEVKKKQNEIKVIRKELDKLYKKVSTKKQFLKKDGTPKVIKSRKILEEEIENKEKRLKYLQEEIKSLPGRIDISKLEDYRSFQKLDNEGKRLFDFVTASVWNARKYLVENLRGSFDEENNLVDLFYAIANCHGWIKVCEHEVRVMLEPMGQPKRRIAQEQLCKKLTGMGAQTPNGKWLVLEVGNKP
ncbi:MAG: hypothetical protein PF693_04495 [Spirochaetia bacterium]|nr:hypothetical protein [Spirochaetia bacterium]